MVVHQGPPVTEYFLQIYKDDFFNTVKMGVLLCCLIMVGMRVQEAKDVGSIFQDLPKV